MKTIVHNVKFLIVRYMSYSFVAKFLIAAICVAIGVMSLYALSPYQAPHQTSFYSPSETTTHYVRANIVGIDSHIRNGEQTLTVQIIDGPLKKQTVSVQRTVGDGVLSNYTLQKGQQVLLVSNNTSRIGYSYYDRYRLPSVGVILIGVTLLVGIVAGRRGLSGVIGLGVSIAVLGVYIVPQIVAGQDPIVVTLIGSLVIAAISVFVAHGIRRRTLVAYVSTTVTLLLVVVLSYLSVKGISLSGFSGEESELLVADAPGLKLSGLLVAGMIIATLGVLDDITTAQAAAVDELHKAHEHASFKKLVTGGMSIGKEHISSLINTLALAYVGVSLPTLIIYTLYNNQPLLVLLNSEFIVQEIVRTGVSSIALILAVPLTTVLAAWYLPRHKST